MKTENKIIKTMLKENHEFTIRGLSKKINSDYKITHTAVKKLFSKDILSRKKVGKSIVCNLNRWNPSKEVLFAEHERVNEILKNSNIKQLYKEIISKTKTSFFIMLLFGSFAKNNYNQNSDIDLLFISNEKDIENNIKGILRLIPLKTHPLVFNEKEIIKMYLSRESNVVKEAINNYILLYGTETFYNIMQNA